MEAEQRQRDGERVRDFLEDSHESRQTKLKLNPERLTNSAIFIAVWIHALPRSTLIVSHSLKSHKASWAPVYTNCLPFFSRAEDNY